MPDLAAVTQHQHREVRVPLDRKQRARLVWLRDVWADGGLSWALRVDAFGTTISILEAAASAAGRRHLGSGPVVLVFEGLAHGLLGEIEAFQLLTASALVSEPENRVAC